MKFDKSNIFTAVNADELKKGDKVIVGDTLAMVRANVEIDAEPKEISEIRPDYNPYRFAVKDNIVCAALAYLVERAEEPKSRYRPFIATFELIRTWLNKGGRWQNREFTRPVIWLRFKDNDVINLIHGFHSDYIEIQNRTMSMKDVFYFCEFLDGTPCGFEDV